MNVTMGNSKVESYLARVRSAMRGMPEGEYAFGYIMTCSFWAMAIEKLFAPAKVGLWYTPGNIWSLTWVTDGNRPANGRELLSWWLVPVTVLIGWLLRYVSDRIAKGWIRRYRRQNAAQGV